MRYFLIPVVLGLAACAEQGTDVPTFPPEALGPVDTEEKLRAQVVGRSLYYGEDVVILTEDGRLDGTVAGVPLTGTWYFEDGQWCRTVTSDQGLALTDCQVFALVSDGVQVTNKRGEGQTFLYTLAPLTGTDETTEAEGTGQDAIGEPLPDTSDVAVEELEPVEAASAAESQ